MDKEVKLFVFRLIVVSRTSTAKCVCFTLVKDGEIGLITLKKLR